MAGELAPWRASTLAERQHGMGLEAMQRQVELAEAEAGGVARVTQTTLFHALVTNLYRSQIEQLDPDGADQYRTIAAIGNARMARALGQL
jgi:hypothetical protein